MDLQLGSGIDGVEATRRISGTGVHQRATVKIHLGRIYDKLGVDTRAVAVAKEQRLLP